MEARSVSALRAWRKLEYGMFIHFGFTTFVLEKRTPRANPGPLDWYNPARLDVGQWVAAARDAGRRPLIACHEAAVRHGLIWRSSCAPEPKSALPEIATLHLAAGATAASTVAHRLAQA